MNLSGKIIIITNRNVNPGTNDLSLFGDDLNLIRDHELNLAAAGYDEQSKKWHLELLSDPVNPDYDNPVSREVFETLNRENGESENPKNWVLFVHGFNQSLEKNLNKCLEIASYGVNVVTFSWPSNPGPQQLWKKKKEYNRAQKNAESSVQALDRTIEKIAAYVDEFSSGDCKLTFNLVVHSLGNYLMKHYVSSESFIGETRIFNNILLHQADVDNKHHDRWLDKISNQSRVYVTINRSDIVLDASDIVNKNRLGNTIKNLNADDVIYIDFTGGVGVKTSHRPWHSPGNKNKSIGNFYKLVFAGKRGEKAPGWDFRPIRNAYELVKKDEF